jgi:hypothetical protein
MTLYRKVLSVTRTFVVLATKILFKEPRSCPPSFFCPGYQAILATTPCLLLCIHSHPGGDFYPPLALSAHATSWQPFVDIHIARPVRNQFRRIRSGIEPNVVFRVIKLKVRWSLTISERTHNSTKPRTSSSKAEMIRC